MDGKKIRKFHIYIYIERERWVQVTPSVTLNDITTLNNLLLDANFEKSTIGFVRLNLINNLIGFILCQICLYFSN